MSDRSNHYDARYGPRDRTLRAADHDREAVTEILRTQHVAGRLSTDEFQERLERAMTATTYADLDELIADFPIEEETRAAVRAPRHRSPLALTALLILVAVLVATGAHAFWLAIPMFFFVVRPLLWRTMGGRRHGCGPWFATRPDARW